MKLRNSFVVPFVISVVVVSTGLLQAEHRVALLIDVSDYETESLAVKSTDLAPLSNALAKRGFRCQQVHDLSEQGIKQQIESFCSTTPTLSTTLVFIRGQVLPGSYKGNSGLCFLGINSKPGRGFLVREIVRQLHDRGGSSRNMIVIDRPPGSDGTLTEELPDGCLFAFCDTPALIDAVDGSGDIVESLKQKSAFIESSLSSGDKISGHGSIAISPPRNFAPGRNAGDEWVNGRGTVFCWCPPGRFTKGSPSDQPGRYPDETQQDVAFKSGFWISKFELTLSENPRGGRPHRSISAHKNDPLTMVNLDDARRMTKVTLTESERKAGRLPKDWEYALTTEDQWEYAARAGSSSAWCFGDDADHLPRYGNFADKAFYDTGDIFSNHAHRTLNDGVVKLARVGQFQANSWGLHDVHGNVAEWCLGTAIRGGSWVSTPASCRCAHRMVFTSRNEQNFIGYRIVIQKVAAAAQ